MVNGRIINGGCCIEWTVQRYLTLNQGCWDPNTLKQWSKATAVVARCKAATSDGCLSVLVYDYSVLSIFL